MGWFSPPLNPPSAGHLLFTKSKQKRAFVVWVLGGGLSPLNEFVFFSSHAMCLSNDAFRRGGILRPNTK